MLCVSQTDRGRRQLLFVILSVSEESQFLALPSPLSHPNVSAVSTPVAPNITSHAKQGVATPHPLWHDTPYRRWRTSGGGPMRDEILERPAAICLALPEAAEEKGAWAGTHLPGARPSSSSSSTTTTTATAAWRPCKAPAGAQEMSVGSDPDRFFVPPYVGHHGSIGMRLEALSIGTKSPTSPATPTA